MGTPRLKGRLKELVRVIGVERMNYSDPITRFLEALYTDCNFEVAQELLQECRTLLDNDFFLSNSEQDFMTQGGADAAGLGWSGGVAPLCPVSPQKTKVVPRKKKTLPKKKKKKKKKS